MHIAKVVQFTNTDRFTDITDLKDHIALIQPTVLCWRPFKNFVYFYWALEISTTLKKDVAT